MIYLHCLPPSVEPCVSDHMPKIIDMIKQDGHEEAQEELPKKAKFFSSTLQNWDAEFYVKVDNKIDLDLDGLITLLESRHGQDSVYIGCMKSGDVITEAGRPWYEPEWWKFGDGKSASLMTYAHDDILVGSWMMMTIVCAAVVPDKIRYAPWLGQKKRLLSIKTNASNSLGRF